VCEERIGFVGWIRKCTLLEGLRSCWEGGKIMSASASSRQSRHEAIVNYMRRFANLDPTPFALCHGSAVIKRKSGGLVRYGTPLGAKSLGLAYSIYSACRRRGYESDARWRALIKTYLGP
jgi:hypothetical protein